MPGADLVGWCRVSVVAWPRRPAPEPSGAGAEPASGPLAGRLERLVQKVLAVEDVESFGLGPWWTTVS